MYISNRKDIDLKAIAKNMALYDYNSKYYLAISGVDTNFKHIAYFYASISEFAKLKSNSKIFESKLIEHGKAIFKKDAIKRCLKYFGENQETEKIKEKGKHF